MGRHDGSGGAARRSRRGFVLLFGSKTVVSADPAAATPRGAACPRCGRTGTLAGQRARPWFTAFLIPLFPIGGGRRFTRCRACGTSFAAPPEQIARAASRSDAQQVRRGITLYNSLRASPGNSVTLQELMTLYLSIGEPAQAVGAAADFPDALNASEQCMTTLGRAYLAAGAAAEAIGWLDSAVARDPAAGEARFQRATAYLSLTPPQAEPAAADAWVARNAGHPGAAEVLRRAEALAAGTPGQ